MEFYQSELNKVIGNIFSLFQKPYMCSFGSTYSNNVAGVASALTVAILGSFRSQMQKKENLHLEASCVFIDICLENGEIRLKSRLLV